MSVFAFGPAESGKTFTMLGLEAHVIAGELTERTLGVAQRCGREVFRLLALEGGDPSAADPAFSPFNPALEHVSSAGAWVWTASVPMHCAHAHPHTRPHARTLARAFAVCLRWGV